MKKHLTAIVAAILLLVVGVVGVVMINNHRANNNTKLYTYSIVNETGTELKSVTLKDDNSDRNMNVTFEGKGLENGGKDSVSMRAVADKDGNPSLTFTYKTADSENVSKITSANAEIKLTPAGANIVATDVNSAKK